jgi:hypothetical protein
MCLSMKLFFYFFFFSFLILPVNAIYAGNSEQVLWFDNCSSLIVEVHADKTIDINEYWFDNCTLNGTNRWSCDCYDEYGLILNTDIRTINTYDITATYTYKGTTKSKHTFKHIFVPIITSNSSINDSEIPIPPNILNKTPEIIPSVQPNGNTLLNESIPLKEINGDYRWLLIIILLILLFGIGLIIYFHRRKAKNKNNDEGDSDTTHNNNIYI